MSDPAHHYLSDGSTVEPSASATMLASHGDGTPIVLASGKEYVLTPSVPGDRPIRLKAGRVDQRNWSRVGSATMSSAADDRRGQRVFVKQYVDSTGRWHTALWSHEWAAAGIASQLLEGVIKVPENLLSNRSMRLNVFENVDLIPSDELLRSDPVCFERMFPRLVAGTVRLLDRLQDGSATSSFAGELRAKQRDFGGASVAVNFKGLDVRNIAFRLEDSGEVSQELVIFDFGKAYLAPIEEAAAKLFISVGLLNWGKPLQRFAKGPDISLLAHCRDSMGGFLDGRALRAELHLQKSFRTAETQGSRRVERVMKRFGIHFLGAAYLRKLENWCAAEFGWQ